jgi:hypothetical protein
MRVPVKYRSNCAVLGPGHIERVWMAIHNPINTGAEEGRRGESHARGSRSLGASVRFLGV